jgi:hypothetical protein
LTKFQDYLRKYPRPRSSAIRAHLQHWLDQPDADAVWQKIVKKAENLSPDDFIRFVIAARGWASGLVPTLEFHSQDRQHCIEMHAPLIKDALKSSRPLSEIANVLEAAAFDFRHCDDWLNSRLSHLPVDAVSRKKRGGSQAHRAFCLALLQFFNEKCGAWMDGEVATLVDIALPRRGTTSEDDVRAYRRPTTSHARKARLQ